MILTLSAAIALETGVGIDLGLGTCTSHCGNYDGAFMSSFNLCRATQGAQAVDQTKTLHLRKTQTLREYFELLVTDYSPQNSSRHMLDECGS